MLGRPFLKLKKIVLALNIVLHFPYKTLVLVQMQIPSGYNKVWLLICFEFSNAWMRSGFSNVWIRSGFSSAWIRSGFSNAWIRSGFSKSRSGKKYLDPHPNSLVPNPNHLAARIAKLHSQHGAFTALIFTLKIKEPGQQKVNSNSRAFGIQRSKCCLDFDKKILI